MNNLFRLIAKACLPVSIILLILSGCCKNDNGSSTRAYSNLRDDTTTAIKVTIPRIEITKLKSSVVKLYLSVTDQDGHPFTDFNEYNFTIRQVCTNSTDTTLVGSIVITKANEEGKNIASSLSMDYSPSMDEVSSALSDMETAVKSFANLKQANDQMEIIKFSGYVVNNQAFTSNLDLILTAIEKPYPYYRNGTAFFDAVKIGLEDGQVLINSNSEYFAAVIGFTDGEDNYSSIDLQSLIALANSVQIPVYALGFGDVIPDIMNTLAEETGGRYYYTPSTEDLQEIYKTISRQLKNVLEVTWTYTDPGCTEITVIVETSYTCKNGTFSSRAEKTVSLL